ncbi:hypothetical protein R84981_002828 [Carnimonas sp. R-84981]|uniref:DUF2184 domain-containing protein n=1 Tax=Carnimonas bestiolae TaxID=3402172 RepID=UPI003EDC9073
MQTFDKSTIDSTGAFLVGELERLDQTLNEPLYTYTWSRDIQLREDVSIADDISSFTNTNFAASGTPNPAGKNWIGKDSTAIAGTNLDIQKTGFPLQLWGMELGWTVVELAAAQQVGRPVDAQKYEAMQMKWNQDTDAQVYIGDSDLQVDGLTNLSVAKVEDSGTAWESSTADQIRESINFLLGRAWINSGYSMVPTDLLVAPSDYAILASKIVSDAGNQSLLTYLETNTIAYHNNGVPLRIKPVKWLEGAAKLKGKTGGNRMVAYTNDRKFVRFPMVPLRSIPIQYRGLYQLATYYGKLGAVEPVYPETIVYGDTSKAS